MYRYTTTTDTGSHYLSTNDRAEAQREAHKVADALGVEFAAGGDVEATCVLVLDKYRPHDRSFCVNVPDPATLRQRAGWCAWCWGELRSACTTDDHRAGWDAAATFNEQGGGVRPHSTDAADWFPTK